MLCLRPYGVCLCISLPIIEAGADQRVGKVRECTGRGRGRWRGSLHSKGGSDTKWGEWCIPLRAPVLTLHQSIVGACVCAPWCTVITRARASGTHPPLEPLPLPAAYLCNTNTTTVRYTANNQKTPSDSVLNYTGKQAPNTLAALSLNQLPCVNIHLTPSTTVYQE